jgi:hypothetical protein
MGEDIRTVHMCVYVADDIVFTKNGYAPREPWVLMRERDMMIHYSPKKPLSRAVFRHVSRLPKAARTGAPPFKPNASSSPGRG